MGDTYDALIIGGGLAGLTFAYQLKKQNPDARVVVVDRNQHPVPEAAFKVGESTSDLAAYYLTEVLGLEPHLASAELRKLAIRFFLPSKKKDDIAARVELGLSEFAPTQTYQLDRGRFENYMAGECRGNGVELIEASSVETVDFGADGHDAVLKTPEGQRRVKARWVVDTSGRRSFLKRKLGLDQRLDHDVNAAWFRVGDRVDLSLWSDDAEFRGRVKGGHRWLSTNHLMDTGYWVWIIPLASGSTSIGVVADPDIVPLDSISRMDRVMDWLRVNEPQCAAQVEGLPVQDFRAMHTYAYATQRAISPDRWGMTGESAAFFDPLYSPGSDFIAIWNTALCSVIGKDLAGEDIAELTEVMNTILLTSNEVALPYWKGAYPVMGAPQAMAHKLVWDIETYFTMLAGPWAHTGWTDVNFLFQFIPVLARFNELNSAVQIGLQARSREEKATYEPSFVDYSQMHMIELNAQIVRPMDASEVIPLAEQNLLYLGAMAAEITGDSGLADGASAETIALAREEIAHVALEHEKRIVAIGG